MMNQTRETIEQVKYLLDGLRSGSLRIKPDHETDLVWHIERFMEEVASVTTPNFSIKFEETEK